MGTFTKSLRFFLGDWGCHAGNKYKTVFFAFTESYRLAEQGRLCLSFSLIWQLTFCAFWWRHSLQKPVKPLPRKSVCPRPGFAPGRNCTGPLPHTSPEAYVVWHWCDEAPQTWTVKCWKRDRCFHPEIWVHRCSLSMLKWKKNGLFIWFLTNYYDQPR